MKINKVIKTKDYNYPSILGEEDFYIENSSICGSYSLDLRTNNLTYSLNLINIQNDLAPLSIDLIYNDLNLQSNKKINMLTPSFRLNISACVEKINDDEYKLYDVDNTISVFKRNSNEDAEYYNITKKNGEILTLNGNNIVIEALDSSKKIFVKTNQLYLLTNIKIPSNEKEIDYCFDYDEDEHLCQVSINNKFMVNITYEDTYVRLTYLDKYATIYIENNQVSYVTLVDSTSIAYLYESLKLKKAFVKLSRIASLRNPIPTIEFTYVNNKIETIKEYRKTNYIQRLITIYKYGSEYYVKTSLNGGFSILERIYSFSNEDGRLIYSYDYKDDPYESNLTCYFNNIYSCTFEYINTIVKGYLYNKTYNIKKNSTLNIKDNLGFNSVENSNDISACIIRLDVGNVTNIGNTKLRIKSSSYVILEETIDTSNTSYLFNVLKPTTALWEDIIVELINEATSETTIEIKILRLYLVKDYVLTGMNSHKNTFSDFTSEVILTNSNIDHYNVYFEKIKTMSYDVIKITKAEYIINHINCVKCKDNNGTFRMFYNDFTNSMQVSKTQKFYYATSLNAFTTSGTAYSFDQAFGLINVHLNNIEVQEVTIPNVEQYNEHNDSSIIPITNKATLATSYITSNKHYSNRIRRWINDKQVVIGERDSLMCITENTYNAYGQVTKTKRTYNDYYIENTYTYNANNMLTQESSLETSITYEYDKYNNLTKTSYYTYENIDYNQLDNVIAIYRGNNDKTYNITYTLDYEQKLINQNLVNQDNENIMQYAYSYDEYGRIKEIKYNNEVIESYAYATYSTYSELTITKKTYVERYTYNKLGFMVRKSVGQDVNSLEIVLTYIYNDSYDTEDAVDDPFSSDLQVTSSSKLISIFNNQERTYLDKTFNNVETYNKFKKNDNGNFVYNMQITNKFGSSNYFFPLYKSNNNSYAYTSNVKYTNASIRGENNQSLININIENKDYTTNKTSNKNLIIRNTINNFNQVTSKEYLYDGYDDKNNKSKKITTNYTYKSLGYRKGELIGTINVKNSSSTLFSASYAYNIKGLLEFYSATGTNNTNYFYYDELNRLYNSVRSNDTYLYTFDEYGNIINRTKNGVIDKTLTYENNVLKNYNGWEYNYYDDVVRIIRGTQTKSRLLKNGKIISESLDDDDGEDIYYYYQVYFEYDGLGRLSSKTYYQGNSNSIKHEYYYDANNNLIAIKMDNKITTNILYEGNSPIGLEYENKTYFYIKNVIGEIIHIVDEEQNIVVTYTYDDYGSIINMVDTSTSGIGSINPIRYKGYYYDEVTKLYYLTTRFYDPEVCRFITKDDLAYLDGNAINGLNLYSYCGCDPINKYDPSGHFVVSTVIIGILIGAATGFVSTLLTDYLDDGKVFNGSVGADAYITNTLLGALIGGITGGIGSSSFTITYPTLTLLQTSTGTTMLVMSTASTTIAGTQILEGIAGLCGLISVMYMSKHRPKMSNKPPFTWVTQQDGIDAMKMFGDANKAADYIMDNRFDEWKYGAGQDRNVVKKWLDRVIRELLGM